MLTPKIALAAALTLVAGSAFAAPRHAKVDMDHVSVARTSMDRVIVDDTGRRAFGGGAPSEPTIWGHAPLGLTFERPLHSGN